MLSHRHEKSKRVVYPRSIYSRRGKAFFLRVLSKDRQAFRWVLAHSERALLHVARRTFLSSTMAMYLPALFELFEVDICDPPKWLRLVAEKDAAREARVRFWLWARFVFSQDARIGSRQGSMRLPSSMVRCESFDADASCGEEDRRDRDHDYCKNCNYGLRWRGGFDPGDRFYLEWDYESASPAAARGTLPVFEDLSALKPGPDLVHILDTRFVHQVAKRDAFSFLSRQGSKEVFCVFSKMEKIGSTRPLFESVSELMREATRHWQKLEQRARRAEKAALEDRLTHERLFDEKYAQRIESMSAAIESGSRVAFPSVVAEE